MLVVAAAASGILTVSFELARSAWIAQRVAPADLPRRNAQLAAVGSLSETVAFALGGWLYQWLGATLSLVVDALSYAVSASWLRGVQEVPGVPRPETSGSAWRALLREASEGLNAVWRRQPLRALASIEVLLAFSMALSGTSYMIFVSRDLGLPTGELGMIFALGGLGSVLGAGLAPRLGRWWGPGRTMTLGLATFALGATFVPLAQGTHWAAVAWLVAHQIVGDAGHTLHDVQDRTLRQTAVPATLLARADAGIRSAGQFATLAGALAGGVLGTTFGTREVLWLAAATAAAAALVGALRLAERRRHGK